VRRKDRNNGGRLRILDIAADRCRLEFACSEPELSGCGWRGNPRFTLLGHNLDLNRRPSMAHHVKAIPEGYHSISPALTCKDAARAIDFYKKAFNAREIMRMPAPDGKISHAELRIGDSIIFLNDEMGPMTGTTTGTPRLSLFLYVEDADTTFNNAVKAGAKVDMPLENQFWGDRYGKLTDPFGHQWGVATHVEDVAPEEINKRAAAFFAKMAAHG
jgi:PhnB protein